MGRLKRKKSQEIKNKKKKVGNISKGDIATETSKNQRKRLSNSINATGKNVTGKVNLAKHKNNPLHKVFTFFKESKSELKKVVWPTKKQTLGSTLVVIIVVGLVALFLGIVDTGLSSIIRMFLG